MEALAARIAAFCLQKHYIEPDQIAYEQYIRELSDLLCCDKTTKQQFLS